ncbi:putative F-box domain-containing protein [Seiridium unicorne]|uniref:F-box domain-containing protein n=1 Tax=Seiridium unicorne TaxID=138068 RepID=A0ABR2UWS3_9PEZI
MMASISNLPPELLNHICTFMQTKREIANFFQCSRQFYAIAAPHLYHHVDLLSVEVFSHTDRTDDISHRVEALVKAFLRDPHLGHLVQHFAIRVPMIASSRTPILNPLDPKCEEIAKSVLRNSVEAQAQRPPARKPSSDAVVENNGSDWESTDESADEDEIEMFDDLDGQLPVFQTEADRWIYLASRSKAIRGNVMLTILLSCLTNVSILDLEMPSVGWRTGFLDRAIQRDRSDDSASSFLTNLRQVCFGYTDPHLRGESWAGPFILPEVKEVYLHHLCGLGPSLSFLTPSSLNITHLELRDCRIPPPSLTRLLAGPKALKTFIYVVGEAQTRAEVYIPISYKSIRTALEKQKDSLERIWLDYPHNYHWDETSTQHTGPMGSFSNFTQLKHLKIAGTYIYGFVWTGNVDERRLLRALPEQIESLCLTHTDEDEEAIDGILIVLDAMKQGRLQQLKEITLEASARWYRENNRGLSRILSFAESVDLGIRLLNNYSDSRIESLLQRRHFTSNFAREPAATREKECPWGFYGETTWPTRVSGCMCQPLYEDITDIFIEMRSSLANSSNRPSIST